MGAPGQAGRTHRVGAEAPKGLPEGPPRPRQRTRLSGSTEALGRRSSLAHLRLSLCARCAALGQLACGVAAAAHRPPLAVEDLMSPSPRQGHPGDNFLRKLRKFSPGLTLDSASATQGWAGTRGWVGKRCVISFVSRLSVKQFSIAAACNAAGGRCVESLKRVRKLRAIW